MNHERRSHRQWLRSAAAGLGSLALGGAFVVGTNVGTATADAATYTSVQVGTSGRDATVLPSRQLDHGLELRLL